MFIQDPEWRNEVESAVEFLSLIGADDRLLYVNHVQPGLGEYEGKPVYEFILPEHHDLVRRSIAAARATGLPQHYESEAVGLDGGTSLYSNWIFEVAQNDSPGVVAFVATDITSLRRIEDELVRSDVTLRSLLEHAPDHIMIVDRERRLKFVNRLEFGFKPDDVMGEPVEGFVREDDREMVVEAVESVIRTGERRSYETSVNSPTGTYDFLTRLGPIIVDDQVDSIVMISTDITATRVAERERERLNAQFQHAQKIDALGQLTGGVAHDFNNLLTAIGGNLELLGAAGVGDRDGATYLAEALRAVDRAADLTRRLLVFARKQPLAPKAERIVALIDDMAPLLRRTIGETISVRAVSADELWLADIDRGQLEQAILNLAVNARDAMPSGGNLAIVSENHVVDEDEATEQLPAGDYVSVTVSDTGFGMDAAVASQAFEPFFSTKDVGHGTGLGLSMVYGFASQSGGHVTLSSEPGEGTTVQMLLPRGGQEEPKPVDLAEPSVRRGNGEVVLVVEDQPIVREMCVNLLQRLGYRTLEADDATQACATLDAHPDTALVLSDVGLPGEMDGYALASQVVSKEHSLPVILMSGYANKTALTRDLPGGVQFVPKPFKVAELASAIAVALDRRQVVTFD